MQKILLLILCTVALMGCTSAKQLREGMRDDSTDRISVANVQREIRVGLSGADVVAALGSPNMITTDAERRETWVYDKVSTERISSSSSGGVWLILGGVQGSNAASSSTQRTLTIIIKFDHSGKVRDYSYRQSNF